MTSSKGDTNNTNDVASGVQIKTEPGVNSVRLSSFRPPRDLTLNNISSNKQIAKKVFTPNLHVVRNKNKSSNINENYKERKKYDKRNTRDRTKGNINNKTPNILKSSGVFSEGIAPSEKKYALRESYSTRYNKESSSLLEKPVFKKKSSDKKIDKEFEDLKIKDFLSDEDACDSPMDTTFLPISLPLSVDGGFCVYKPEQNTAIPKHTIKQEPGIKSEPITDVQTSPTVSEAMNHKIKNEPYENNNCASFLHNAKPTLFMLQFPDSIPGRGQEGRTDQNDKERTEDINSGSYVENVCKLEHLEEGQIGKITLHKSGKVHLKLGNTYFDLTLGSPTCFRQDIMSISVNTEERTGRMINLGNICAKIMAIPNWERLFKEAESL